MYLFACTDTLKLPMKLNLESRGGGNDWMTWISYRGFGASDVEGWEDIRRDLERFHGLFQSGKVERVSQWN